MPGGLYTLASADNIDYNLSAPTAKILFKCKNFVFMQHRFDDFDGNNYEY